MPEPCRSRCCVWRGSGARATRPACSTSTPSSTSSGPTTRGPAPPPWQPVSLLVRVSVDGPLLVRGWSVVCLSLLVYILSRSLASSDLNADSSNHWATSPDGLVCLSIVLRPLALCVSVIPVFSTSTSSSASSGPTTRGPALRRPCQLVSLLAHVSVSLALSSPVHVFVCDTRLQYVYTILNFIRPDYERTCASSMTASESRGPCVSVCGVWV